MSNDYEEYNEINYALEEIGVEEISYEEVVRLTFSNANVTNSNSNISTYASNNNVTFRTQYI